MTLYAMISCHLHVDAARYLEYLHSTKKGRVGGRDREPLTVLILQPFQKICEGGNGEDENHTWKMFCRSYL